MFRLWMEFMFHLTMMSSLIVHNWLLCLYHFDLHLSFSETMESSSDSNKHDIQDDWIEKILECPVCFNIPRDLPIPQCPAGHIICKTCRDPVSTCPTCRRRLFQDGTSSLAASLIEKVPHKCKFSVYGCEVKDLLGPLKVHEEKCAERTIRCLLFECRDIIQVKKFEEHFKDHQSNKPKMAYSRDLPKMARQQCGIMDCNCSDT